MLSKEGLHTLTEPIALGIVLVVAVAFWWLFRPNVSPEQNRPMSVSRKWRFVLASLAFASGPLLVVTFEVLTVFVFHKDYYIPSDFGDGLAPAVVMGIIGGLIGAVLVLGRFEHEK